MRALRTASTRTTDQQIAVERDGPHPLAHAQAGRHRQPRAARAAADDDGRRRGNVGGGRRPAVGRHRRGRARRGAALPGAGRAAVGMGAALDSGVPGVAELFSTASKILGYDLLKLCKEGPMEKLDDDVLAAGDLHRLDGVDPKLQHEKPETLKRAPRAPRNSAARNLARNSANCARALLSSDAPRRRRRRPPASRSASTRRSSTPARCRSRTG